MAIKNRKYMIEYFMEENYEELANILVKTLLSLESVNQEQNKSDQLAQEYKVCMKDTRDFLKKLFA